MRRPVPLAILICSASAIVNFGSAVHAQQLHVILVADDENGIAQHTNLSTLYVSQAVEANMPQTQLSSRSIENNNFRTSQILASIDSIVPAPRDSILFYYVGHGAVTQEGKPYMISGARRGEDDLYVAKAMRRLAVRGAHSVIAVFDMCSICPNCDVAGNIGGQPAEAVSPLFNSLFFQNAVQGSRQCVISSSRGQPALTLAPISESKRYDGGMYSWYFAKYLVDSRAQFLGFNTVHTRIRDAVKNASRWHPQKYKLTVDYDEKQVAVQYNVWQQQ